MSEKPIGFVILNYKTWEKTIECVRSIRATVPADKIIVVVDNASPNESAEQLAALAGTEEYEFISSGKNGGYSFGNNIGFQSVKDRCDIVVFTNNDIVFTDGAAEAMAAAFHEETLAVGPLVKLPTGELTNPPTLKTQSMLQLLGLKSRENIIAPWEKGKVFQVVGCCFAVNAKLFEAVGCFDDHVFLYHEEYILGKKAQDAGLEILFEPNAVVIHDHGSTAGNNSEFVDREMARSAAYYFRAYEGKNPALFLTAAEIKIAIKRMMGKYEN